VRGGLGRKKPNGGCLNRRKKNRFLSKEGGPIVCEEGGASSGDKRPNSEGKILGADVLNNSKVPFGVGSTFRAGNSENTMIMDRASSKAAKIK